MDFRKPIKNLMKQKGIKTAELARRANLTYGTVDYFLKGTSNITTKNLNKLFYVLDKLEE